MLTEIVINLLQKMLKQVFVDAMGLQDLVRAQNLSYDVYQNQSFVRVIHNGRYHWLPLSTYGCKKGEIYLLDSKFNYVLPLQTKRQVCTLLCCCQESIKVNIAPVQQKAGGVDCGFFAVAFIQYILSEKKIPNNVSFAQSNLRNHALKCLKNNNLFLHSKNCAK